VVLRGRGSAGSNTRTAILRRARTAPGWGIDGPADVYRPRLATNGVITRS
jgi:hypothetical protein